MYQNVKKLTHDERNFARFQYMRKAADVLIRFYEKAVNKLVTSVLNQNQFDALVSFTYNLGAGALAGSTLLKKVNVNPNDESIENEFKKWVNARNPKTGKLEKSNGLVRRRKEEAAVYFS